MFNYFGSKASLARSYQSPRHDVIVEPFAGSAQYAVSWMAERQSLEAVLVDSDPLVIASWRRMLDASPDDIMQWTIAVGDPIRDYVDKANYGGGNRIANERIVSQFNAAKPRWARTRAAIDPARITLIHGTYTDAPDIEATWFIDPPYQHQGQSDYKHGSRDIDFNHLAGWCQDRPGQTVVCEAHPANWLPFQPHRKIVGLAGATGYELVWYSHPDPTLF